MATEEISSVVIPFPSHVKEYATQQYQAVNYALQIKKWLVDQGLVLNQDFEWKVNIINKTIVFYFLTDTSYATLVALQFIKP